MVRRNRPTPKEIKMKEFFWIVALLSLLPLSVICEDSSNIQCNGKLGFCSTELYSCLKSRIKNDKMYQCHDLFYPSLYDNRVTDEPLAVFSSEPHRDAKLQFGLVAINETTNSWSPVKKCCNLSLNEFCQFRPTLPGEHFTLLATTANGEQFCYNPIQEYPTYKLQWCFVVEKAPCLFFDNGEVFIRPEFEDASTRRIRIRTHYCFFEVSTDVVLGNVSKGGIIRDVPGIKMVEGNEHGSEQTYETEKVNKVETDVVVSCDMKMNVDNHLQYMMDYEVKPNNVICFFIRVGGDDWLPKPCCKESNPTPNNPPDNVLGEAWKKILVVLCVLIFVLLVLLILRNQIKKCIPSYHDTERDISNHMPLMEENVEFLNAPKGNFDVDAKEVPDEIFICGFTAKDETGLNGEAFVLQNEKNVNNNEEKQLKHSLDSGNGAEAKCECRHHFSYCAKEDVPYQKENISKPETDTKLLANSLESSHDLATA